MAWDGHCETCNDTGEIVEEHDGPGTDERLGCPMCFGASVHVRAAVERAEKAEVVLGRVAPILAALQGAANYVDDSCCPEAGCTRDVNEAGGDVFGEHADHCQLGAVLVAFAAFQEPTDG